MESDLSQPVTALLHYWGYTVYSEVPLPSGGFRAIDLVGAKPGGIIGVELKTSLTRYAATQGLDITSCTPAAYVAVPTRPRPQSVARCRHYGVGILTIVDGEARIHTRPTGKNPAFAPWVRKLSEILDHMEPGGMAGKPNELGIGPAQDVQRRVAVYRAGHPRATWEDVYTSVSNHYASAASMCSAMRMVDERRYWRERRRAEREVPHGKDETCN